MFSSNGIDQRTTDLYVRPSVRGTDANISLSGKTEVDPSTLMGAGVVNIIFDGQSTNNNSVNSNYAGSATNIYNLSVKHKGRVFTASDPLLNSDITQGHHGHYLARSLIDDGTATKVILTLTAFGGSYCADHAPGGGVVGGNVSPGTVSGDLAYRIGLTARCIQNAGLWNVKTIIDWQQGEWDSDDTATTQANYEAALNKVVAEYKRVGLLRTGNVMFINRCTRITNSSTNRDKVRFAQLAVPDAGLVRQGADIDTITSMPDDRFDDAHFTAQGAAKQAALKKPFIADFILNG